MSLLACLALWQSGPILLGVCRLLKLFYLEFLYKMFVMRRVDPILSHLSDFIAWT